MSHDIEFLRHYEPPVIKRRRNLRRAMKVAGAVFGLLFLAWGTVLAVAGGTLYAAALDGRDALIAARDEASALEFDGASQHLAAARADLVRAERAASLLNAVALFPFVRRHAQAAGAFTRSGIQVVDALDDLIGLGGELTRLSGLSSPDLQAILGGQAPSMTFDDLPSETKRAILQRLASSADELDVTRRRVEIALEDLERVPEGGLLSPVRAALEPARAKLAEFAEDLRVVSVASRMIPAFAGLNQPKTTLVLLLNNAELRPGGGFIGTYGVLTAKDGDIAALTTRDVYALDRAAEASVSIAPPEPLRRWLGLSKWFFRDANWSPDFAVSSRLSLERFRAEANALSPAARTELGIPASVQQVVGVTPDFASALLRITGPIAVGGQTFTAENVFDLLEYQVEFGFAKQGIPEAQRKEILADLVNETKARLFALPVARWQEVIGALNAGLTEKQVLLYSEDQALEDVVTRAGWGGRFLSGTADAIGFVDANLGSLKSDPAVRREIRYEIETNSAGERIGRLRVAYRHEGAFDYKTTRYRTYARLYVPRGSQWIRTTGSLADDRTKNPSLAEAPTDVGEDLGMTVFGTFTSVEPGETRELVFEFRLAPQVAEALDAGSYGLTVFKQAGAAAYPLTLDLDFGKKLTDATPPEDRSEWGDGAYRLNTNLDQDRRFTVGL